MLKAILFDIDGVLVDTLKANVVFYQQLMTIAGYKPPSSSEVSKHFHLTMKESIKFYSKETSSARINEIFEMGLALSYPKELMEIPRQAQSIVRQLSKSYLLGLVTGRVRRGITDFFDIFHQESAFKITVTAEEYTLPKPNPEPLLIALHKLHLPANQAIYIGDMQSDIQAARAANMKVVIFESKKTPKGADYYFNSFTQLPQTIIQINA